MQTAKEMTRTLQNQRAVISDLPLTPGDRTA